MLNTAPNANEFIEQRLDECIHAIENELDGDAFTFSGPVTYGVDDLIRASVEEQSHGSQRLRLIVILTTFGGYIEVVQRIVATLRHHYEIVDFVVPSYAYSAGTVLAMSGDAIWMDYYSRLGPIDPQVETQSGRLVSALGYLERYEALIAKAKRGQLTTAELQILLGSFDQGELYQYEQARDLSVELIKDWLVKYKFKTWGKTRTRKRNVTKRMKERRAAAIAKLLNNTKRWHSHGYGISREVLERDVNLQIDDFGKRESLSTCVRQYHDLLTDYMGKRSQTGVLHSPGRYRPFMSTEAS